MIGQGLGAGSIASIAVVTNPRAAVPTRISGLLGSKLTIEGVGEDGVEVSVRGGDRVVDVRFDGRRIWSFWALRDTEPLRGLHRLARWPRPMRRFLDGRATVAVVDPVTGGSLFEREIRFGSGTDPIRFVNAAGLEISLDKSGRFSPTFSVRSPEQVGPLLDGMERVCEVLAGAGLVAFPAWGTLLGAIREKDLIGHDSDADLTYLSAASTPVDVSRESFRLQRLLNDRGFATYRYSGAAFRIDITEADGTVRGLDLFASFYDSGRYYVMGEMGADFREEWLVPFGTCEIAGRTFNAPARPDKVLEGMYGPGWRVPDPAFRFTTPQDVVDRLTAWFRGLTPGRREWDREFARAGRFVRKPSDLARALHAAEDRGATVLDVGTGRGADALWLAMRRRPVVAYDYANRAARPALRIAERKGLELEVRRFNLTEMRSVFGEGARVSRLPGRRVVLARHVLDATTALGRQNFARFASMVLRGGGRLYAEVLVGAADDAPGLTPVDADALAGLIEEYGGRIVSVETEAVPEPVARVIAEWT